MATLLREGKILSQHVVMADDFASRLRGLLFAQQLDQGHGLFLNDCSSVHMFFMRYAIDVVFLGASMEVIDLTPMLKPWRVAWSIRSSHVLELCSGTIDLWQLRQGERLVLQ